MDFMFLFFAVITILGALIVFSHPSIVHSAFGLRFRAASSAGPRATPGDVAGAWRAFDEDLSGHGIPGSSKGRRWC